MDLRRILRRFVCVGSVNFTDPPREGECCEGVALGGVLGDEPPAVPEGLCGEGSSTYTRSGDGAKAHSKRESALATALGHICWSSPGGSLYESARRRHGPPGPDTAVVAATALHGRLGTPTRHRPPEPRNRSGGAGPRLVEPIAVQGAETFHVRLPPASARTSRCLPWPVAVIWWARTGRAEEVLAGFEP